MSPEQIEQLRQAVAAAKQAGNTVLWLDPSGGWRRVREVPTQPLDPDQTGFPEIVALLDAGHLDLGNCDAGAFRVTAPLFPAAA